MECGRQDAAVAFYAYSATVVNKTWHYLDESYPRHRDYPDNSYDSLAVAHTFLQNSATGAAVPEGGVLETGPHQRATGR
jgi:hypothetical protein